jgi:hypothetical protein
MPCRPPIHCPISRIKPVNKASKKVVRIWFPIADTPSENFSDLGAINNAYKIAQFTEKATTRKLSMFTKY